MMRNLKTLGLALVAVFAMSAIAASAAQAAAAHFKAGNGEGTAFITATQDDEEGASPHQVFETAFGTVDCSMFKGSGSGPATTEEVTLENIEYSGTTSNTTGENCEAFGFAAKINFHGCTYLFHSGVWNAEAKDATGTADLICPAGQSIEINAGGGICVVKVPPQSGLNNITYTNHPNTPADVTVHATTNNIEYEGTGGICSGAKTGGVYTGTATVKGYSDSAHENQIPIEVKEK